MKEYISREATIKRFEEIKQSWVSFKDAIFLDGAMAVVENIPIADVVEVKHGRWVSFLDGESIMPERYYRCSICRRVERNKEPYCNCGAKMDLEE